MDAPPSQYRVIERGRKLIVLDAQTNLPPKRACDFHPTGHGLSGRRTDPAPPTPILVDAPPPPAAEPREPAADGIEEFFESMLDQSDRRNTQLSPLNIGLGAVGIGLFLAIIIGGVTGFLLAAATIIIAGNVAWRKLTKRR